MKNFLNVTFNLENSLLKFYALFTLKKTRLKITQLEKVRFIKVNELKLTQVESFSFFHFMCAAASAFELLCMTHAPFQADLFSVSIFYAYKIHI